jgi:hypothetical protein
MGGVRHASWFAKRRATVTDTSPAPLTPTGAVKFSSTVTTDTFKGSPCTLTGSGGVASCHVTFTPDPGFDSHTVTAHYEGDPAHHGSTGKTRVLVQG